MAQIEARFAVSQFGVSIVVFESPVPTVRVVMVRGALYVCTDSCFTDSLDNRVRNRSSAASFGLAHLQRAELEGFLAPFAAVQCQRVLPHGPLC